MAPPCSQEDPTGDRLVPDLSKITCIEDLRVVAKRRVPRMFYDYADSGAWTESTCLLYTSDAADE